MKRKKGYFSISAVAKMFSVHQQTIRLYEREGLITPKRSQGNTRLFSEEDVDRLEEVVYLTHELGINLAGVDMILKLRKQIKKLQKEINNAFDATQIHLEQEEIKLNSRATSSAERLNRMRNEGKILDQTISKKQKNKNPKPATIPLLPPPSNRKGEE